MASKTGAVWAIDIGNCSLKALRLSDTGEGVEVVGFYTIGHDKILTGSGIQAAERDELIALSLRRFVESNRIGKDDVVVSVSSQNSFARFVKLPPVEKKRIPEIVKFEAVQQIPFDINEVQWDWQMLSEEGSSESRIGIFAIKNEIVSNALSYFSNENISVTHVQMAPMALYNYILYDRPELTKSDKQAVIVLNIGADITDLVICTRSTVWQRSVSMGGNAFTRAVSETFKLNFEKAEKLKCTAAMSKYARQIFQAMRPVFTDLASEIQRSIGFYTSSNPDTKLVRIVALGGGTKMRGLLKYLQQTLQIPVETPDSFKMLSMGSEVSAAKFHDSVCDFGIVYGLGLQGLALGKIESNLLPQSIAKSMAWANKARHFTMAAILLFIVSVLTLGRVVLIDNAQYSKNADIRTRIGSVVSAAKKATKKLKTEENRSSAFEANMHKEFDLFKYRDVFARLYKNIIVTFPNEENNPGQADLYRAFDAGDVESVMSIRRKDRKQIFITNVSVRYTEDVGTTGFEDKDFRGGGRKTKTGGDISPMGGLGMLGPGGMMVGGPSSGFGGRYAPGRTPRKRKSTRKVKSKDEQEESKETQEGPGFIINISGYSPYRSIDELLDPVGVSDDKSKWGVVTRMMRLEEILGKENMLKLYKKTEVEHFSLETGPVDFELEMPVGIGIVDENFQRVKRTEQGEVIEDVLVDPMTKEVISKVAELDWAGKEKVDSKTGEVIYKENDYWFILQAKFLWKDAPKSESEKQEESKKK